MGKIAAIYDVRGIQEFIFSSQKLKENIGASVIVKEILDSFLMESIKKYSNTITEWFKYPGLKIKNQDLNAEVVYSGGGNALVIYKDEHFFDKVNQQVSRTILEKTGGSVNFVSAWVNTDLSDSKFQEERKALIRKLRENKYCMRETSPLNGIAITREGVTDGFPAQKEIIWVTDGKELKEYISFTAEKKRCFEKEKSFEEELPIPENLVYPEKFDDLGQKEGESHIAVVHIDGNNMGKKLKQLNSYEEMKDFSRQVNEAYKSAMKTLVKTLIQAFKDENFFKRLNLKQDKEGRFFLPLRSVVLNGDDVTFVTDGRIGIPLAEKFLQNISKRSVLINDKKIPLSCCAGIAIVKSHFPFYRAYQLADELCSSAKLKGKILAAEKGTDMDIGNWVDYHIVYSGLSTVLSQLRQRLYNIPAFDEANPIKFPVTHRPEMEQDCYNLLWRPWCVVGDFENQYQWKNLKEQVLDNFLDTSCWPRSRLKKLRNDSIKSKADIKILLEEFKSRGKILPEFEGSSSYFRENDTRTPYFDALELLDFYIELPNREGEE